MPASTSLPGCEPLPGQQDAGLPLEGAAWGVL